MSFLMNAVFCSHTAPDQGRRRPYGTFASNGIQFCQAIRFGLGRHLVMEHESRFFGRRATRTQLFLEDVVLLLCSRSDGLKRQRSLSRHFAIPCPGPFKDVKPVRRDLESAKRYRRQRRKMAGHRRTRVEIRICRSFVRCPAGFCDQSGIHDQSMYVHSRSMTLGTKSERTFPTDLVPSLNTYRSTYSSRFLAIRQDN
jgi:hypothetical protein